MKLSIARRFKKRLSKWLIDEEMLRELIREVSKRPSPSLRVSYTPIRNPNNPANRRDPSLYIPGPEQIRSALRDVFNETIPAVPTANSPYYVLRRSPIFEDPIEGTLSFLTTETYPLTKTVVVSEIGVSHFLEGFIDLSEAVSGEPIDVIYSVSILSPVVYKSYAKETYDGAPANPQLHICTLPAVYGVKVEMHMDAAPAADRSFAYQFFRRRIV